MSEAPTNYDFSGFCVLVVEDDEIMRMTIEDRLQLEGIPVVAVCTLEQAYVQLSHGNMDMVLTDIRLPDGSGADLFHKLTQHYPGMPIILMTAFGQVSDVVSLIKAGAADYLTKPFELTDLIHKVRRNLSRVADISLTTNGAEIDQDNFMPGSGVLGKSPAMRRIERIVARLREVDSSVLITGESGVGKEVVASLIHENSMRSKGPIIKVNCAAIPPSLIESELFGHVKGAFTGADRQRIGRFEQAKGGTIFLDEIAEVSSEIQVKFLRVLQERTVERVGDGTPIPLDVRVIAATQVNLEQAIENNRFRADLYWRLNVIHIPIPPLRERREDILHLSRMFVAHQAKAMNKKVIGISPEAEAWLIEADFPGNIRQLKNMLERAVVMSDGTRVELCELQPMSYPGPGLDGETTSPALKVIVQRAEREAIVNALARHDGSISQSAEALKISRKNIWEKMKRYGIDKDPR